MSLCCDDHEGVKRSDRSPLGIGTRRQDLHRNVALRWIHCVAGKVFSVEQVLADGVVPVDHEYPLQNGWAFSHKPDLGVAPGIKSYATIQVLLANIHTAGISNAAVDDGDLPMIAVADCVQWLGRVFGCHSDSRREHVSDIPPAHMCLGTYWIIEQPDLNS